VLGRTSWRPIERQANSRAARPAGIAAILRDVTESWNRERALRAQILELEARAVPR
jgi:hypothetical protein